MRAEMGGVSAGAVPVTDQKPDPPDPRARSTDQGIDLGTPEGDNQPCVGGTDHAIDRSRNRPPGQRGRLFCAASTI